VPKHSRKAAQGQVQIWSYTSYLCPAGPFATNESFSDLGGFSIEQRRITMKSAMCEHSPHATRRSQGDRESRRLLNSQSVCCAQASRQGRGDLSASPMMTMGAGQCEGVRRKEAIGYLPSQGLDTRKGCARWRQLLRALGVTC
jgi:hypothetical protein